jgi:hypothetical protein
VSWYKSPVNSASCSTRVLGHELDHSLSTRNDLSSHENGTCWQLSIFGNKGSILGVATLLWAEVYTTWFIHKTWGSGPLLCMAGYSSLFGKWLWVMHCQLHTIALLNSQTIHDKGNHQFIWIGLKPTFCMSIFLKVMVRLLHGYRFTCSAWETGSTVTDMVWEFCNWGYTVPLTVVS